MKLTDIFDEAMLLKSDRLILRPLNGNDLDDFYEIFSDREVMRYYDVLPLENREQAKLMLDGFIGAFADRSMLRWGIEYRGKMVGTCGFFGFKDDCRKAEMGYELNSAYHRLGIMSEALTMILDFIFAKSDINRVEAYAEPDNTASLAVLKKLGFTREGTLRQYEYCRDGIIDITIWGLLRSDREPV